MNNEKGKLLEANFWRTRLEAKALYKAWQITPDDSKLMEAYAKAWQAHQEANMAQFLWEGRIRNYENN